MASIREFVIHALRRLVNGNYYGTVFKLLPLRPGDRVLEIGCGMGDACAALGAGVEYLGIDVSESCLDHARRWYERPGVSFRNVQLEQVEGRFTHALVICTLHHLAPVEGHHLAQQLRRLVEGPVLVADPDALRSNWIQRLILSWDRGAYPLRPIEQHLDLLRQEYRCRQILTQDLRARLGRLTYSLCEPI